MSWNALRSELKGKNTLKRCSPNHYGKFQGIGNDSHHLLPTPCPPALQQSSGHFEVGGQIADTPLQLDYSWTQLGSIKND
jgi:hypothetical protein